MKNSEEDQCFAICRQEKKKNDEYLNDWKKEIEEREQEKGEKGEEKRRNGEILLENEEQELLFKITKVISSLIDIRMSNKLLIIRLTMIKI